MVFKHTRVAGEGVQKKKKAVSRRWGGGWYILCGKSLMSAVLPGELGFFGREAAVPHGGLRLDGSRLLSLLTGPGWIHAPLPPHGHISSSPPRRCSHRDSTKSTPPSSIQFLPFFFFFLFFLFLLGASSRRRQGRGGRAFSPRLPHGGAGSDPLVTLSPNSDPGSTLRSPGRRRQRGSAQLCPSSSAA